MSKLINQHNKTRVVFVATNV